MTLKLDREGAGDDRTRATEPVARDLRIGSLGQAVLTFWFTQLQSLPAFHVHAVIFGFFMSAVMTGLIVCVRELTPVHMRGMSNGIVVLFAWFGIGLGGYQAGARRIRHFLRDRSGDGPG